MGILIRETYEVITPESAEQGDTEERGWIDEEGTEYTFTELVALLQGCEHSGNDWATCVAYDFDYTIGGEESRSYHPVSDRDK